MKRDVEENLKYLHVLAVKTVDMPLVHRNKIRRMIAISNKHQIRLAKEIKRTLCFGCHTVLIPSVTCVSRIVRKECGLCMVTVCGCRKEKVIVMKNK